MWGVRRGGRGDGGRLRWDVTERHPRHDDVVHARDAELRRDRRWRLHILGKLDHVDDGEVAHRLGKFDDAERGEQPICDGDMDAGDKDDAADALLRSFRRRGTAGTKCARTRTKLAQRTASSNLGSPALREIKARPCPLSPMFLYIKMQPMPRDLFVRKRWHGRARLGHTGFPSKLLLGYRKPCPSSTRENCGTKRNGARRRKRSCPCGR